MPRPGRIATLAFPSLLLALAGCAGTGSPGPAEAGPADILTVAATVFDARSRTTQPHHTVFIECDRIAAVLPADVPIPEARRAIDAGVRLLTPGLIDVHSHTDYILGVSISEGGGFITRLSMDADSIA